MGLTDANWKLALKVTVNGTDITGVLLDRLVSLRLVDQAGLQSDSVEIILADHNPLQRLALPSTGAEITVALGYGYAQQPVGIYIAEEIEASGPPDQLRITGFASAFGSTDAGRSPINDERSRSWPEGTTVAALVNTVAGESGFTAAVSAKAGAVVLPHTDQIDESDIALLSRVARDNGLIFKPGGGKLVMVQAAESSSASGRPLPVVTLTPKMVSAWSMSVSRTQAFANLSAHYRDTKAAKTVAVKVEAKKATAAAEGQGGASTVTSLAEAAEAGEKILAGVSSAKRVKRTFATQAAAKAAATASYADMERKTRRLQIRMPGHADVVAEGRLVLSRFRPGLNREWLVTNVAHMVTPQAGWSMIVDAELSL